MRISKSPRLTASLTVLGLLAATGATAWAQGTPIPPTLPGLLPPADMAKLATKLGGLLVVATVMESALTTIFTWRLYREFCNGRAVKTLVMIFFGLIVVNFFNYDIFHDVVLLSGGSGEANWISVFLSSLVLAGGSTAINQLFRSLGLRTPVENAEAAPRPPQNKAWVSVRVAPTSPGTTNDDFLVCIEEVTDPAPTDSAKPSKPELPMLAGVVRKKTVKDRMRTVFGADTLRVPASGGWTVNAGKVYRISAGPSGGTGAGHEKEVYLGRFAAGAIVDFVVTI